MDNNMTNIITFDEMGDYLCYRCNISESFIVFEKDIKNNAVNINNTKFIWNEPKLVMNLLNFSLNDLISKFTNIEIKYFTYTVMKDDLNLLDITKWTIIKDDNIIVDLRCDLDDCFENVMKGFIHNQ